MSHTHTPTPTPQSSELKTADLIIPDWPAPANVRAFFTTRSGGVSTGAYASLNLGAHVGDEPELTAENRRRVATLLPAAPVWLNQVHGVNVVRAEELVGSAANVAPADASVTAQRGVPCAVMVADCLPVLFSTKDGSQVGAAHAGWRGLLSGVLERTVEALDTDPLDVIAWLGPAIGPNAFEVGAEVFAAFTSAAASDASAFRETSGRRDKFLADIYALARARLLRAGIKKVFGGDFCTVSDPARFFSYRRHAKTGRMAGVIWIE